MHSNLRTIVGRPDLRAVHSKASLKQAVLCVLDSLCGMSGAARVDSASLLFSLLCPAATDAVTLLGKCLCLHTSNRWGWRHYVFGLCVWLYVCASVFVCLSVPLHRHSILWLTSHWLLSLYYLELPDHVFHEGQWYSSSLNCQTTWQTWQSRLYSSKDSMWFSNHGGMQGWVDLVGPLE